QLNLEYRLKQAAHSALRTLWHFALAPTPENLHELVEGAAPALPMPQIKGDILIRMEWLPPFADTFPIEIVGGASIEVRHHRPQHEAASSQRRPGEDPENAESFSGERRLSIPPYSEPPSSAFRRQPDERTPAPGADPFASE